MLFWIYKLLKNWICFFVNYGFFVIFLGAKNRSFSSLNFCYFSLVLLFLSFIYQSFNIMYTVYSLPFIFKSFILLCNDFWFFWYRWFWIWFRIIFGFNLKLRILFFVDRLDRYFISIFCLFCLNFFFYYIYFSYFLTIYLFLDCNINNLLIIFCSVFLIFLSVSSNTFIDSFLINIHQKYFFFPFQKWIVCLFRPYFKFQTFFIIVWIICLVPFFLFIHYFFLPYIDLLNQFILNIFKERYFQIQSLATFDELIDLLGVKRIIREGLIFFWLEYTSFFFSLPKVLGFYNFSISLNILINSFFLFFMICGLKIFKIQQSMFYSYLQFNFNKIIYYFIILKIFFIFFFSFFNLLIFLSNKSLYNSFETFYSYDFIDVYVLGFFIDFYDILIYYFTIFNEFFLTHVWCFIPLLLCCFFEAIIYLFLNFINNCCLYVVFLLNFFFEIQYSVLFFWEFSFCFILFILFYFLFLNPQRLIKYYAIDFFKYYHRAYKNLGDYLEDRRETRELAEQAHFKIGAVCEPMVKEFQFQEKSFYFIEKNLSYYYDISIMHPSYESIYYFFQVSAHTKSTRYLSVKFDYSRLFNPFIVFYVLYIPFAYMRLNVSKRLVKQAIWSDYNARTQRLQDTQYFEHEFVIRWVALLNRFSRKISPNQYKQWVTFYNIEELAKRHNGLLDIFYLHR